MSWRGDRNHLNDPNVPDFLDALEHGNHEGHGHRNFNNGMQSAEHNYLGQPQESPSPYHQMNWPGIMAPMGFG
jgi:hypothetical protein